MRGIRSSALAAAAVLAGALAGGAADPPGDAFSPAESMQGGPRSNHSSVLLEDGRVLVVGGHGTADGSSVATGEVYDPLAGTWSAAGTMSTGRSAATASLLPDGRVLVAGGSSLAPVFSSTEIWDPESLSFSPGPSMSTARGGHSAVSLADGRILVTGGYATTAQPVATATAEIYDPVADEWSATGSMLHPRQVHAAVLLLDGRVLVTGGDGASPAGYKGTAFCDIFDPVEGTWSAAASMAAPRSNHALVRLADGRVLVVGGNKNATGSNIHTAEVYDPATDAWTPAGSTGCGGTNVSLTLLADGRALAAGGQALTDLPCALADLFDPGTGEFAPLPAMAGVRMGHSANLLSDGRVLLAGGYTNISTYPYWTDACEFFVPEVPPQAPGDLQVTGTGVSTLTLGWTDNSGNEASFELERALPGGAFAVIATPAADTVEHTDADLLPATLYRYRLRAVNARGASGYSGEVSARTEATASLEDSRGSLVDSARPGKDRISYRTRFSFNDLSPGGTFSPGAADITFRLGSPDGPFEVVLPASGPGWQSTGKGLQWTSPKGALPKVKFLISTEDGFIHVKASNFDFPVEQTSPILVDLVSGEEGIHEESEWRERGVGVFSYP